MYVATRIKENLVFNLRCPHEGCKTELYEQDVLKLPLESGLHDQFAKLRAQDYSQRLKELKLALSKTLLDMDTAKEMIGCARLCPRCHVILQKSSGCNSFYCVCGHHFQYDKAPRLCDIRALRMAENFSLSLEEAERKIGQGFLKGNRLALQMGISLEEALEMQKRAQAGDEIVRAQIRAARRRS
jgi:hypothetical protein